MRVRKPGEPFVTRAEVWEAMKQMALIPLGAIFLVVTVAVGYALLAPWRWLGEFLRRFIH